jgi:phosphoribosyl 1,2-cyclic phosphodiesterase
LVRQPQTPLTLLLSHWHHDHTQGLAFFAPLHQPKAVLQILAQADDESDVYLRLCRVMGPPEFPVHWSETRASKRLFAADPRVSYYVDPSGTLRYDPVRGSIRIRPFRSDAHPGRTTLFRIEYRDISIVYATDIESDIWHAQEIVDFARDADLLIHDAQYSVPQYQGDAPFAAPTRSFGHSTNVMAAAVAWDANARQLVLFHHDPNSDDDTIARIEAQTQALFPASIAAREGLELELTAGGRGPLVRQRRSLDAAPVPNL